jgi:hypothetical protein
MGNEQRGWAMNKGLGNKQGDWVRGKEDWGRSMKTGQRNRRTEPRTHD